jgi:hypothetical protein
MFRISKGTDAPIIDVATVEQIGSAIGADEPGRYHVDEINRDPLPSGHTSRGRGVGIKCDNGSVVIEADPWEA